MKCTKCKRDVSKSNFKRHICIDVNSDDSKQKIKDIRRLYDDGLSNRKIKHKGFNNWLVDYSLKGQKRKLNEAIKLAHKKYPNSFKHTEETKEKIRKKTVENLIQKAKRRHERRLSYGEELLHKIFVKNEIYKKYDVVNEYCEYPYFIDFAFVNEKVAVEFDGHWHFVKKGQERDAKKDLHLQQKGWRVYRIMFSEIKCFDINKLIHFIGDPKQKYHKYDLIKYNEIKEEKRLQKKIKRDEQKKQKKEQLQKQKNLIMQNRLEDVRNLDLNQYGSINKLKKKWKVSHTQVRRFLKLYYY